jgi:hypothetical protein
MPAPKRSMVVSWALASLLAHQAAAGAAHPKKPNGGEKVQKEAQARSLYKKGMTHYELGEFDAAIDEFKRAYALTSAPGLLFNIAQVQRHKKDAVQALFFYRMYLRTLPAAPNRADVEALIAETQAQVDSRAQALNEERERAAKPAPTEPSPPPPGTAAPPPATAPSAPPPSVVAPSSEHPPEAAAAQRPPSNRWRYKLWSGVGMAALGLGALASGIYVSVRASDDADQLARASEPRSNAWDAGRQALYRDGQSAALAAPIVDAVGGVLVAGGAVLSYLGMRERSAGLHLMLAPAVRGGHLVISCDF